MAVLGIRFIKSEDFSGEGDHDDYVRIKSIGADNYEFVYTHAPKGEKKYEKTADFNRDQLVAWFRGTFRLIAIDMQPFKAVQFDFPIVPSVLIRPKDLNNDDEFYSLVDLFSHQLDYLDDEMPALVPIYSHKRHMFFDEDGNEIE
jgi:hypothetical protein